MEDCVINECAFCFNKALTLRNQISPALFLVLNQQTHFWSLAVSNCFCWTLTILFVVFILFFFFCRFWGLTAGSALSFFLTLLSDHSWYGSRNHMLGQKPRLRQPQPGNCVTHCIISQAFYVSHLYSKHIKIILLYCKVNTLYMPIF